MPPPANPKTRRPFLLPVQALLHRLSGDLNPLHADPAFAQRGGFPAPILHGLATLGICTRLIVTHLLGGDAAAVQRVACRFEGVVFPGETLAVAVRRPGPRALTFEARVADRGGARVIGGGTISLRRENEAGDRGGGASKL